METDIITIARTWIGTPYKHQMSTMGLGCDCLGLLRGVWRTYYGSGDPQDMPNYSPTWVDHRMDDPLLQAASNHMHRIAKKDLQAGDVVLFRMRRHVAAKHCAIITDDGTMIHAYNKHGVVEQIFDDNWKKKVTATFRFRDK